MSIGISAGLTRGGGRPSAGPVFTSAPVYSGTTVVGDVITVAFTVTSGSAITASVKHYRDGVLVETDTPSVTSGVEATAAYTTAAAGSHQAVVEVTDSAGRTIRSTLPKIMFAAGGEFSAEFDSDFNRSV